MTFNQMNYFLTVAKYLNFSRAATSLFVSQSTLSRSIASMENELNVTLFDRRYHNLKLTPAGELLYREGEVLMNNMNELLNRLQTIDSGQKKRLAIGILDGQKADPDIILAMKSVLEKVPEFSINIRRIDYDAAIQGFKDFKLDAAQMLVPSQEILGDNIESLLIGNESYYLVARNDDSIWTAGKKPKLSDLNEKTILMPRVYPDKETIVQCFSDVGVAPKIRIVPDMETLSLWIESGIGMAICNASHVICVSGEKRPVRIELMEDIPQVPMILMWNKNNLTPLMELFLSFI